MNIIKLFLCTLVILISGCSCKPYHPTDQSDSNISRNNINKVTEITTKLISDECGEIPALIVSSKTNEIILYCLGSGEQKILDIESKSVLESYSLGIASNNLQISKDGAAIIGPLQESTTGKSFGNINVWTRDNILNPTCVDWCDPGDEVYYSTSAGGIALSDDGKWAIAYYGGCHFFLVDIENNIHDHVFLCGDADYAKSIGDIAFHPNGNKYAVSYLNSADTIKADVQIFRFSDSTKFDPFYPFSEFFDNFPAVVIKKSNIEFELIKSLTFSPDGKWLASINDQGVNIWRLNLLKKHTILDIDGANILAFDENSEFLFIVFSNKIDVYDLKNRNILTTYTTPNITSVSFGGENEMLVWGDSNGIVHFWGIK